MRRQDMQPSKLVDYALRLGVGAVARRLGYLLELSGIAPEVELARLRRVLTLTYLPLDPVLPRKVRTSRAGACSSTSLQKNSKESARPEVIPQRNISLLSNRLAAGGGRRIREDVLERDYCLAWFLAVLSQSTSSRLWDSRAERP